MSKILIGIDVGVKTGFAKTFDGELVEVKTMSIIEAMESAKRSIYFAKEYGLDIKFYIEDARKRKWVTGGREKLQGVGSVKRDSSIWQEFCEYHGVDYALIAPKDNSTKTKADYFERVTGWQHRTSEHARDAVMLIWGRK